MSALGNALTLASPLPPAGLLSALNGIAPDLFFTAATPVDPDFPVRRARRRWYRYFEHPGLSLEAAVAAWKVVGPCFEGTVDVRSLGRRWPAHRASIRAVESVTVTPEPPFLVIDVRGPSFVWGMVRRIVAAGRAVTQGRLTAGRLRRALEGKERLTLPLAEPEPLVLWDVDYGVPWIIRADHPTRQQSQWRAEGVRAASFRARWLAELARAFP